MKIKAHCSCGLPSVRNEGDAARVDPEGFTPVDVEGEGAYRDALLAACRAVGVAPVVCECGRTLYTGPAASLPPMPVNLRRQVQAWRASRTARAA